jgi:hypothetical protein
MPFVWTPDRLARLRDLREGGESADVIRDHLGISKNTYDQGIKHLRRLGDGQHEPAVRADDPILRSTERQLKESRQQVRDLRAALDEADAKKTIVEQAAEVIRDEIRPWDPRPLDLPKQTNAQFEVDGAVSLTDEHADEVVAAEATWGLERYNFDVFRIRLARWAKVTAAYLRQHLPRYRFERLWVQKLGDSQHGNLHLPGQKYRNHFGNDIRAAIAIGEAEAEAIAQLAEVVPQVIVTCLSGNHPRQTTKKDYGDPHDNLDFLVATVISMRLKKYQEEGRVQVLAPRSYSAYQSIRGWVNALNHGDDVVGTWSIPWYGFAKHEARVQAAVATAGQRIDYFWYGHFHTDVGVSDNGARAIHSGAFTRTDDFALNKMKAFNEPSQVMEVFDEELGRIIEVPIYLRDVKREAAYWAGSYKPELGRDSSLTTLGAVDEIARGGSFPLIEAR